LPRIFQFVTVKTAFKNEYRTYSEILIISDRTKNSLKYLRSTTLGGQDIGIRIFEFVAKTQFLSYNIRGLFAALEKHELNFVLYLEYSF